MRRGAKRPNLVMADLKKRKLGLLLFLTVQVVSLAVLEYQQQTDMNQSIAGECPSLTMQLLIPVLTLWESMLSTTVVASLKRPPVERTSSSDDDESEEEEEGEQEQEQEQEQEEGVVVGDTPLQNGDVGNKKRKMDSTADRDQLATVLVGCSEAVQAAFADHTLGHNECSLKNGELDRLQRKEHSDQLIGVLGHLAEIVGQIAEKW